MKKKKLIYGLALGIIIGFSIGLLVLHFFYPRTYKASSNKVVLSEQFVQEELLFGIKFPFDQFVSKELNVSHSISDQLNFNKEFIQLYDSIAKSSGLESSANLNNQQIRLSVSQPTWLSTWQADLFTKIERSRNNNQQVTLGFDFIFGPQEGIFLEHHHGLMAKDQLLKLINKTLNSFPEKNTPITLKNRPKEIKQ